MSPIVLNDEQAKQAASSLKPVEVCDSRGNILGTFTPFWTEEDIAEAKRRLESDEPRYTTEQVLRHLESLEPQ
jgi:hypothetical protein